MHNQYELLMNDFDHNTIDPSIRLSLNDNKVIVISDNNQKLMKNFVDQIP